MVSPRAAHVTPKRLSGVEQKIAAVDARLLKWMIGLWIVTLSAMGVLKIVG